MIAAMLGGGGGGGGGGGVMEQRGGGSQACGQFDTIACKVVLLAVVIVSSSPSVHEDGGVRMSGLRWSKLTHNTTQHARACTPTQLAEATWAALDKAADEQALIEGAARRRLVSELGSAGGAGLVVVRAVYGVLPEYHKHRVAQVGQRTAQHAAVVSQQQEQPSGGSSDEPPRDADSAAATGSPARQPDASTPSQGGVGTATAAAATPTEMQPGEVGGGGGDAAGSGAQPPQPQPGASSEEDDSGAGGGGRGSGQQSRSVSGRKGGRGPPPHPWLDVTLALQYLVADGQLTLHGGMPKSGLMGFTDPAPHIKTDGAKQLMIVYQHKVRFF